MVNGRNKGQRGEREFIALLQSVVDNVLGNDAFELHRNLDQTRAGGADVEGAPVEYDFCAFEIKRQEQLQLNQWWKQAAQQANNSNRIPVLAYKQSRQPWKIQLPLTPLIVPCRNKRFVRAEICLDDFLKWYENLLRSV